jgi:hypothetical protein
LFVSYFGGIKFRKPMGNFSRERAMVNEELGAVLAKTTPFFVSGAVKAAVSH